MFGSSIRVQKKVLLKLSAKSFPPIRMFSRVFGGAEEPPKPTIPLDKIETPALCVDLAALERNEEQLNSRFQRYQDERDVGDKIFVRPHVKSHKCPYIAKRQLKSKCVKGLSCATVGEVIDMVEKAGARDILLTNEIVTPEKIDKLLALALKYAPPGGDCSVVQDYGDYLKLVVCVDSLEGFDALFERIQKIGITIGCLIDVNVGQNRCGLDSPNQVLELAQYIRRNYGVKNKGIRFIGLQGYEGGSQHLRTREERIETSKRVADALKEYVEDLADAGIACEIVSGGGTGSFLYDAEAGALNEVQPGSYLFMDVDYGLNEEAFSIFEPSLFVLSSVISSSTSPKRFVLDAGIKSHAVESGLPKFFTKESETLWKDFELKNGGDEHLVATCTVDDGAGSDSIQIPKLCSKVKLLPGHVDPTFNLHNTLYIVKDDQVVDAVEICRGPL